MDDSGGERKEQAPHHGFPRLLWLVTFRVRRFIFHLHVAPLSMDPATRAQAIKPTQEGNSSSLFVIFPFV
jgi:hypothetical protein